MPGHPLHRLPTLSPLAAALLGGAALHAAAAGSLFTPGDSGAPIDLSISAPFAALFAQPDGHERPMAAQLSYRDPASDRTWDLGTVNIEVRGNTSRRPGECDFPKLTLDLPDQGHNQHRPPLFDGVRSVKLGTHCSSRADDELTPLGRWANEKAAFREALAYRLLDAAGVPALRARPIRATYRFTDGNRDVLTRDALLIETDAAAARRLTGLSDRLPERAFTSARDVFAEADTVRLHFGQAMIGNFDWCLRLTSDDAYRCARTNPLWNLLAVGRPGRTAARALPVIQDLDLAGTVVGRHSWFTQVFNRAALPGAGDREIEVVAQLQHARARFSRRAVDFARRDFLAREPSIRDALARAPVDDRGRALALEYIDAFFHHLANERFFRPVVVGDDTKAFADATRRIPVCNGEPLRRGTPITVIAHAEAVSQVHLLDVEWQWAPPHTCEAATRGAVWIESAAIGRDFPR